jgi:hypothetical protein
MKRQARWLVIPLLATLLIGCGDDQDPDGARALWDRIHEEDYRNFDKAPGYSQRLPSVSAHADMADVYVNDVMATAIGGAPIGEWPVGSLVVKDGFNDDGEHEIVAAMDKRADGWFWAEWDDLSGEKALFSGRPETCTDCHQVGSDFVRAFGFPTE